MEKNINNFNDISIVDGQLWESDKYVLQIQTIDSTIQAVIYTKTDNGLRFFQYIWKEADYLKTLIRMTDMKLTSKKLSVEEGLR